MELTLVKSLNDRVLYMDSLTKVLSKSKKGPVHANIPFDEPFYPTENQVLIGFDDFTVPQRQEDEVSKHNKLNISHLNKILVVIGQVDQPDTLNIPQGVPVITYPLSNMTGNIQYADTFIAGKAALRPELLITFGLSIVSKNLKKYLRKNSPTRHLHLDPLGIEVDTYRSKPEYIRMEPSEFFNRYAKDFHPDATYMSEWNKYEEEAKEYIASMNDLPFCELTAFRMIHAAIPPDTYTHLGNSMPVRYAEIIGARPDLKYRSNRGTSGIDGTSSTAMGAAWARPDALHILITGDIAFLYDRNAFFHEHAYENLRIVVLNNQGGGIFRLIDGPSRLPELETYFETRHSRTAEWICKENTIAYHTATNDESLRQGLKWLMDRTPGCRLLEIFTDPETNQASFKKFKSGMNQKSRQ
jgi:2-succinyl-5-enolpyruvyl-6-hydroxy-3-cyclohexene-1-carboxylate synthase